MKNYDHLKMRCSDFDFIDSISSLFVRLRALNHSTNN
jgi:hypothetical protein